MDTRMCAFAGSFYPKGRSDLEGMIDEYVAAARIKEDVSSAMAYVAPHAGYVYSGKTAAHTYKAIKQNKDLAAVDTIIIIGPNHTGIGTAVSVSDIDWETPLGTIRSDTGLAEALCGESDVAVIDETAHAQEHSIEVQLPFLQRLGIGKRCVFVCMGSQEMDTCTDLGNSILDAAKGLKRKVIVVASSDFNHYEQAKIGEKKDMELLKLLGDLDYARFNPRVNEIGDTACGYGPITVAAMCAKETGARRGVLLDYSNSGHETQDFDEVVDYASLAFL